MKIKFLMLCLMLSSFVGAMKEVSEKYPVSYEKGSILNALAARLKEDAWGHKFKRQAEPTIIKEAKKNEYHPKKGVDFKVVIPTYDNQSIEINGISRDRSPTIKEALQSDMESDLFKNMRFATKQNCNLIVNLLLSLKLSDAIFMENTKIYPNTGEINIIQQAVKNIDAQQLLECIFLASFLDISVLFKQWTSGLLSKDISGDLLERCENRFQGYSSNVIKNMASLLIPESYKNNESIIALKNNVKNLKDFLFILSFRQHKFNPQFLTGPVYGNLSQSLKDYLQWQKKTESAILFFKDYQHIEIPKTYYERSRTLNELITDIGTKEILKIPSSIESWDTLWKIVNFCYDNSGDGAFFMGTPSEELSKNKMEQAKELLSKITEQNIENILNLDLYLDINPRKIKGLKLFFETNRGLPFFSLMHNQVEKKAECVGAFCYQSFILPTLFECEFAREFTTTRNDKEALQKILLETSNNNTLLLFDFGLNKMEDEKEIFVAAEKRINEAWEPIQNFIDMVSNEAVDIGRKLPQFKDWTFSIDDNNKKTFAIQKTSGEPSVKAQRIYYTSTHPLSCFSVHPLENIIALGTTEGTVEFLLIDTQNNKRYCLSSRNALQDEAILSRKNYYIAQNKAVKCIDWNDAGTECAVAGGENGRFWYCIYKFEQPKRKKPVDGRIVSTSKKTGKAVRGFWEPTRISRPPTFWEKVIPYAMIIANAGLIGITTYYYYQEGKARRENREKNN